MKLLLLFGDGAVGKMTVGQELCKITDLRLFHNHMTIEPVIELFGTFHGQTIQRLRDVIFEEFAQTDLPGMIFTFMWAFDLPTDWDFVADLRRPFEERGAEIYYAELVAPLEVRLERNVTENRLRHKPSKRNIEFSNKLVADMSANHRFISREGEIPYANYIKIDNTTLSPADVAGIIKERFSL
jgi:hypothetical protein